MYVLQDVIICFPSITVIKDQERKQLGEERGFWLSGYSPSSGEARAGTPDGILQAGTEAESVKNPFWLDSSSLFSLLCLYHPGPPTQGWHHPRWAGHSHINHKSQKCPADNRMEACRQLRFLFPNNLAWVKLTKTSQDKQHGCLNICMCA